MASSSPGKKVFSFIMWIAMVPFALFAILLLFVNIVVAAST